MGDIAQYRGEPYEVYNARTDQWLPAGDPRLPKPKRSNGWNQVNTRPLTTGHAGSYGKRTPTDQRVRSTKETHMPERLTKAQIDHELKVNEGLMQELAQRRKDLQKQKATAIPAEPPSSYTMFTVSVRFNMRGKRYQFLILRTGKQYFTTGSGVEHKRFDSWEQLCQWLEGPKVYDHTNIEILQGAGKVVSFDSGTIMDEDKSKAPF